MARWKAEKSLRIIAAAKAILEEVQPFTVQGVCYKLFVQHPDLVPSMAFKDIRPVYRQMVWAREHGEIPWEWIVPEHPAVQYAATWPSLRAHLEYVRDHHETDPWQDQPKHIEVWSEKGTVSGILAPVLEAYRLDSRVFGGWAGASDVYQACADYRDNRKPWVALYVGDHDPSGMRMSEVDLPDRVQRYGGDIRVVRIAITARDHGLTSFSVLEKRKDKNLRWYRQRYGDRGWELDAMDPRDLRRRVEREIKRRIDRAAWDATMATEAGERQEFRDKLEGWGFGAQEPE